MCAPSGKQIVGSRSRSLRKRRRTLRPSCGERAWRTSRLEIRLPTAYTQGGFWTMPLAWDIKTGTLEIVDTAVPADQRVLADYKRVPASIGMWSGPTPPGGVTTEIVLVSGNLEKLT